MFSDTVQDGGGRPFTGKSKGPGVGVRGLLAEGPRGSARPGRSRGCGWRAEGLREPRPPGSPREAPSGGGAGKVSCRQLSVSPRHAHALVPRSVSSGGHSDVPAPGRGRGPGRAGRAGRAGPGADLLLRAHRAGARGTRHQLLGAAGAPPCSAAAFPLQCPSLKPRSETPLLPLRPRPILPLLWSLSSQQPGAQIQAAGCGAHRAGCSPPAPSAVGALPAALPPNFCGPSPSPLRR
ncbi:hypothetical protein J1605_016150 [Eschrichtius robustus]|uniref:Uncharacterized protein n=1 Tax=Eschrichtius robustus TaxID=9764 RepID=A0AB34G8S1_ESCRO|nr:hypothetical protein J1605_016150 [Eschrichtius robustus]